MKTALFLRFLKSLAVLTATMDLHMIEGDTSFRFGAGGEIFFIRRAGDAALIFAGAGAATVIILDAFFSVAAGDKLLILRRPYSFPVWEKNMERKANQREDTLLCPFKNAKTFVPESAQKSSLRLPPCGAFDLI